MKVLDPGLLTTVQDLGRVGHQKIGITPGGAMDTVALRVANVLVGNDEGTAALEITLRGPTLEFEEDAFISICGADLCATIADVRIPTWRTIFVQRGAVLSFGTAVWGCRAYLTVAGAFDVPNVMGSRSTYLRASIGGLEGRALRAGDEVRIGTPGVTAARLIADAATHLGPLPFALGTREVDRESLGVYRMDHPIRSVRGPHFDLLDERDRGMFFTEPFRVSPSSDRMGYRLDGPVLRSAGAQELISSAVLGGTVQLPPGGQPIVLMADRQTTGGYPMIAHVIGADLSRVAQLKPGDEIRFKEVTVEDAQDVWRRLSERLATMRRELRVGVEDRS